jgi:hypothetical protein
MKLSYRPAVFLCLSLIICLPGSHAALASPNQAGTWEAIGQVGGTKGAVYAQDDLVYVGVGQLLVIGDVMEAARRSRCP